MPQLYHNAVVTNAGLALLDKAQVGEASIRFTRMVAGDGIYAADEKVPSALQKRTGLKSEKNSYALSSMEATPDGGVKLAALLTNQDPATGEALVTDGYYINEIGLYAEEKDKGGNTEVLYSVAVAMVENGEYMPPFISGHSPAQIIQEYYANIGNAAEVVIKCAGAVMLAEDAENLLKGLVLSYDEASGELQLKSGDNILSTEEIKPTGSLPADGGNADTVDGFHASQTRDAANTAVVRDASGHVQLNYINSDTENDENPAVSQILVTNGTDGYYRKASLAHLKNNLGVKYLTNVVFSHAVSNGSTRGYINFMEFKVGVWDNYGIVFSAMTRCGSMEKIRIVPKNQSSPDPVIEGFQRSPIFAGFIGNGNEVGIYLAKTAESTWNLYAFMESYSNMVILGFTTRNNISFKNVFMTSLPTGYLTPTEVSDIP